LFAQTSGGLAFSVFVCVVRERGEFERERGEFFFFSRQPEGFCRGKRVFCPPNKLKKGYEEFGVVVADGRERRRRQKRRREEYVSKNATATIPRGDDDFFEAKDHPHWPIHFCVCFGVCDDAEFAAASRLDREGRNDDANESERILVIRGRGFGVRV